MLRCLQNIDAGVFASHTKHFLHYPFIGPNVWKPYFDGRLFLADPESLLRSGNYNKVPVVIGTNSEEGALNMVAYFDGRANFAQVDEKWRESLGPLALFHRSVDETNHWDREMAQKIKHLYFSGLF